jgi:hypothetical protein
MKYEESPKEERLRLRWRRFYRIMVILWSLGFLLYLYFLLFLAPRPIFIKDDMMANYFFVVLSFMYMVAGAMMIYLYISTAKPDIDIELPKDVLKIRRDDYFHYRDKQ